MNPNHQTPTPGRLLAHDLALKAAGMVYRLVERVPPNSRDMADQARRASASVPLNLAEGSGRAGRDRLQHYRIALVYWYQGDFESSREALEVALLAAPDWPAALNLDAALKMHAGDPAQAVAAWERSLAVSPSSSRSSLRPFALIQYPVAGAPIRVVRGGTPVRRPRSSSMPSARVRQASGFGRRCCPARACR